MRSRKNPFSVQCTGDSLAVTSPGVLCLPSVAPSVDYVAYPTTLFWPTIWSVIMSEQRLSFITVYGDPHIHREVVRGSNLHTPSGAVRQCSICADFTCPF